MVKTIAARNGLCADFSPKPLPDRDGNGMHINFSVKARGTSDPLPHAIAGILEKIRDMTAFLNPCDNSYDRLGRDKAPGYITWSSENRSQLIRIPAAVGEYRRAELRSPDPMANPYLAYALMIYAGLHGIKNRLPLPAAADINTFTAPSEVLSPYQKLPISLKEAMDTASSSKFIKEHLPASLISSYCLSAN